MTVGSRAELPTELGSQSFGLPGGPIALGDALGALVGVTFSCVSGN